MNEEFDFNREQQPDGDMRRFEKIKAAETFATASMIFGILSILSVFCCCPIIVGALGMTFALLSKGGEKIMSGKAKIGLWTSVVGIVISLAITVGTILMPPILVKLNPQYEQVYKDQYEAVFKEYDRMLEQGGVNLEDLGIGGMEEALDKWLGLFK